MWGVSYPEHKKEDCCEASCWDLTNIVGFIAATMEILYKPKTILPCYPPPHKSPQSNSVGS